MPPLAGSRLLAAIQAGKAEKAAVLLEDLEPEDLEAVREARDSKGRTILHWAAMRGATRDIVKKLLECGVDPEMKDAQGVTAMEAGVQWRHPAVVECIRLFLVAKPGPDILAAPAHKARVSFEGIPAENTKPPKGTALGVDTTVGKAAVGVDNRRRHSVQEMVSPATVNELTMASDIQQYQEQIRLLQEKVLTLTIEKNELHNKVLELQTTVVELAGAPGERANSAENVAQEFQQVPAVRHAQSEGVATPRAGVRRTGSHGSGSGHTPRNSVGDMNSPGSNGTPEYTERIRVRRESSLGRIETPSPGVAQPGLRRRSSMELAEAISQAMTKLPQSASQRSSSHNPPRSSDDELKRSRNPSSFEEFSSYPMGTPKNRVMSGSRSQSRQVSHGAVTGDIRLSMSRQPSDDAHARPQKNRQASAGRDSARLSATSPRGGSENLSDVLRKRQQKHSSQDNNLLGRIMNTRSKDSPKSRKGSNNSSDDEAPPMARRIKSVSHLARSQTASDEKQNFLTQLAMGNLSIAEGRAPGKKRITSTPVGPSANTAVLPKRSLVKSAKGS